MLPKIKYNKALLIAFMQLIMLFTKAQSLVDNGYFEIHDTCPNGTSQIKRAIGWYSALQTPDYYNSCATFSPLLVPYNQRGYQQDCCGGGAYSGIVVFNTDAPNNYAREYMQTKLIDTLKSSKKYLASMLVNKSEVNYAISSMGMLFTDTVINLGNALTCIYTTPQIKNKTLLYDTLNWILVQDTFIANGTEAYLTIGNFNTNATSDSVNMPGNWPISGWSYDYIDGVSVYDITNDSCNNLWDAGFDKYIFAGDSIRLGAINTDNSIYSWQNSAGGATYLSNNTDARPWATPSVTTTYYVTKTCPNNNMFYDTVTVYVQQHVGIKQLTNINNQISVYPNPNNGNMFVDYNIKEDGYLEITDITGNLVKVFNLNYANKRLEIENDNLGNGIYFMQLKTKESISTQKIIVQH